MAQVEHVEWKIPWQEGVGIEIDRENRTIGVRLRAENNLIICNDNNELYTDLQLVDGLKGTDQVPVGVLTWRVIKSDWRPATGTLLSWKTTSGDLNQFLYGNDGLLYFKDWDGVWHTLLLQDGTYKTAIISDDGQGNVSLQMQYLALAEAIAWDSESIEWLYNHIGQGGAVHILIVNSLPATGEPDTIYFVSDGQGGYDQYVWDEANQQWINTGTVQIDLSNYVDKTSNETIGGQKTFTIEPILPTKNTPAMNSPTSPAVEKQVYDVDVKVMDKFWLKEVYTTDTAYTLTIDEIERRQGQYHNFFHFLSDDTVYYYQQGDAVGYFQGTVDGTWNVLTLTTNQYSWFVRGNTMTFTKTDDGQGNYTYNITDVYTQGPDSAIDLTGQINRINYLYANGTTFDDWKNKIQNNEEIYFNAHTVTPVFVGPGQGATYTAGKGISIDANNEISVDTTWGSSWDVLSLDGSGNIIWSTPISGQTYQAGEGIAIDQTTNPYSIKIDKTGASQWDVLGIDWSGNIVWTPMSGWQSYQAGPGIAINTGTTPYSIELDATGWADGQILRLRSNGWSTSFQWSNETTYWAGAWLTLDQNNDFSIDQSNFQPGRYLTSDGLGNIIWDTPAWGGWVPAGGVKFVGNDGTTTVEQYDAQVWGTTTVPYTYNSTVNITVGGTTRSISLNNDSTQNISFSSTSPTNYQWTVSNISSLPSSGNAEGDVYYVSSEHCYFEWREDWSLGVWVVLPYVDNGDVSWLNKQLTFTFDWYDWDPATQTYVPVTSTIDTYTPMDWLNTWSSVSVRGNTPINMDPTLNAYYDLANISWYQLDQWFNKKWWMTINWVASWQSGETLDTCLSRTARSLWFADSWNVIYNGTTIYVGTVDISNDQREVGSMWTYYWSWWTGYWYNIHENPIAEFSFTSSLYSDTLTVQAVIWASTAGGTAWQTTWNLQKKTLWIPLVVQGSLPVGALEPNAIYIVA